MVSNRSRCSRATPSISSSSSFTRSRMLDSVRTFSLISLTMSFSKLLALSPGGLAGAFAPLQEGVADVVGVPAALGLGGGHGLAAGLAFDQAAEQVGAGSPAGVHLPRNLAGKWSEPSERLGLQGSGARLSDRSWGGPTESCDR